MAPLHEASYMCGVSSETMGKNPEIYPRSCGFRRHSEKFRKAAKVIQARYGISKAHANGFIR